MKCLTGWAPCNNGNPHGRRWVGFGAVLTAFFCLSLLGGSSGFAMQQHDQPEAQHSQAVLPAQHGSETPASDSHVATATHSQPSAMPDQHTPAAATTTQQSHGTVSTGEHDTSHGEHHPPPLPELSPIPGVTFVETLINLMDYELNGRFFGWRPNDIIIGRFTDNVNNYQLGVLEAVRFTTLRLKDSLTRMGDSDAYDPDLEYALNLLMNSATSFWFPSAESSYNQALDHLRKFVVKLKTGQRNFYYRKDNLITLLGTYKDLLGNVNRTLVMPSTFYKADDYFYYAKGVSHVYYEILRVVRVGYQKQLSATLNAQEILDEIIHELYRVENVEPLIILNGDLDGILANHRANLNAPLSEVTHLLGTLSQF